MQDELHTSTKQTFNDEAAVSLTHNEQLGIRDALASLDAGEALPFDEVMADLENFEGA